MKSLPYCCRLLGGPLVALFLRFVLDQLSKSVDDKMYAFGVQTLRCFQGQLQQWPQVCQALVNLPNFQQNNPDIFGSASQVLGLPIPALAPVPDATESYSDLAFQPVKEERPDTGALAGNGSNGNGSPGEGMADGERELHGDGMQEDEVVPQPHAATGQGVIPGQEISPPGQVTPAPAPAHTNTHTQSCCYYHAFKYCLLACTTASNGVLRSCQGQCLHHHNRM